MAVAFVQGISDSNTPGSPRALAFSSNVTKGHLLVAMFQVRGPGASVSNEFINDTLGNFWVPVFFTSGTSTASYGAITNNAGGTIFVYMQAWYCISKASGANTVTIASNQSGAGGNDLGIAEFSGITNPIVDVIVKNAGGASTAFEPLSITTGFTNEIIVAMSLTNSALTTSSAYNSPFVIIPSDNVNVYCPMGYCLAPTASTYNLSGTFVGNTGANTNASWAFAIRSTPSYTLATSASDSFSQANENPLSSGGKWTNNTGETGGGSIFPLQVVSHTVEGTGTSFTFGSAYYNAVSWSANQWSSAAAGTLNSTGGTNYIFPSVRISGTNNPAFYAALFQSPATAENSAYTILIRYNGGGATFYEVLVGTFGAGFVPTSGDTLTIVIVGTLIQLFYNGNFIAAAFDTTLSTGSAGIGVFNEGGVAFATISAWSGGSANLANNNLLMMMGCGT